MIDRTEIEVYRTRKGHVILDTARNVFEVFLHRRDGVDESVLETPDEGVAVAFLKDYPAEGVGGGR
jgi:hypothetical protein